MYFTSPSNFFAGKVHGSLARAGKVRGQTPKVAKQDKKKKPRGRAHKRMQYNRRFVTAVVGFGKKRGPNSSENYKLDFLNILMGLELSRLREVEVIVRIVSYGFRLCPFLMLRLNANGSAHSTIKHLHA
ncbi:hypothetical protein H6P81_000100 [Aristolochia fimbriata]|uniref:40S ribosomal protein S30 n=1 Tax=Aristolochia fimbriata TaxID=158543 RepID=A0AAV7F6H0_ARIFI|nr:hypothetical protein H6P81_000100 [Aristolochia fimbriata]